MFSYSKINVSSKRSNETCICGNKAPIATLSVIRFFDRVVQFTVSPLAINENIFAGCTAFATGNGSLKEKIR